MRPTPALAIRFTLVLDDLETGAAEQLGADVLSLPVLLADLERPSAVHAGEAQFGMHLVHGTLALGGHQRVDFAELRKEAEGLSRQRLTRGGAGPGDGRRLLIGLAGECRPAGGGEDAARPIGLEQLARQPIRRAAALLDAIRQADGHVDAKRPRPGACLEHGGEVRSGQVLGLARLEILDDHEPAGVAAVRAGDEGLSAGAVRVRLS